MTFFNYLYSFWKKELLLFNKNLVLLRQYPARNAVHEFRVSIKKFRAALALYRHCGAVSGHEFPIQKTEELFQVLGKQRDLEICLELVKISGKETGKKYPELECHFRTGLSTARNWTKKSVSEYHKGEITDIGLLFLEGNPSFPETKEQEHVSELIHSRLASCKEFLKKPHTLRQNLKEIYYWMKIIPAGWHPDIPFEKTLHGVLDDFGNWQDLQVFERRIRHFRKDAVPHPFAEYASIKMLESTIKEKKQSLLKTATSKTRQLIRKASRAEKGKSEP